MRFAPYGPRRSALLLALAAVIAVPPAQARPEPPREINSLATQMSPRISKCLIRREPALIDRWLRTLPGSAAEARLFRSAEARFPPCFGEPHSGTGGVWLPRYDRAGMRAALVRALLQARRGDLPAAAQPGGVADWYPRPAAPPHRPDDAAAVVAAELGECLARRHWAEVLAIVRSVDPKAENDISWGYRESKDSRDREAAAVDSELSKVIPSVAGCVPAGATIRVNRLRLRTLLEETAWQMTKSAGLGPAGTASFKTR
ncbi:MAG: hypothetical protein WBR13_12915 [Allosphingosinicella sp.]